MGIDRGVGQVALIALQLLAGWRSLRNYRALPSLGENALPRTVPKVCVVVPARDEEDRLPALLRSLRQLTYDNVEVLIVDDQSRDRTAAVAREHGFAVLSGSPPPVGWTGKCWACQQGADATTGEWLLFTDADTVHGQHSLARAVAAAHDGGAALLSLLARQRCDSIWERLLVPYAYALYFVGAARVNQPGGVTLANGQYLLFDRAAYRAIGGHGSVRSSVIEDVEIARRVDRHGGRVALLRAENDLTVRMYHDLASVWEGFGKNAVRFVTGSPRSGIPTVVATMAWAASLPEAVRGRHAAIRLALYLAPALALLPWERGARISPAYALLHPVAALAFQLLALDSIRRTAVRQGTVWRGRRY